MTLQRYAKNLKKYYIRRNISSEGAFFRFLGPVIDKILGLRCSSFGYQYSEIVESIEKYFEHFYTRANNCSSLYDCLLALRGWQREEINGIEYGLNSILTEKWEGKEMLT